MRFVIYNNLHSVPWHRFVASSSSFFVVAFNAPCLGQEPAAAAALEAALMNPAKKKRTKSLLLIRTDDDDMYPTKACGGDGDIWEGRADAEEEAAYLFVRT